MDTVLENGSDEITDSMSCEINSSDQSSIKEVAILDNNITMQVNNISEKSDTTIVTTENGDKISSLSVIALEYENSDSETEDISSSPNKKTDAPESSEMDVQILSYRICRNEVLSSDETDSEEDSSSSSSSDCSTETVSDGSDGEENTNKKDKKNNASKNQKSEMKNEWDDLPPIEDLKITVPEVLCEVLGEVAWMVEQLVVVQPKPGKPTLNLDTVLFIERGKGSLGKIFDVFGQVNEPHYCVRFNSTEHIKESDIEVGMKVYYCPNTQYTSLVFLHELTKLKGTDGGGDDEPPEFSDDEEEQAYYEMLKQKPGNNVKDTDVPMKRKRTSSPTSNWQSNNPWNRNAPRHKKDNQFTRRDRRQAAPAQNGPAMYATWPSGPYQNNWPPPPRHMQVAYGDSYNYGPYSNPLQAMQYADPNVNSPDQSSQDTQNNYPTENYMPMGPRLPYNARHRLPGFGQFPPNRANAPFPNMRFRQPDMSWQTSMSTRMNAPWVSLPPPPPPPPPASGNS